MIRKTPLLLLALLGLSALLPSALMAQEQPCKPDCPQSDWVLPPLSYLLKLPGGCQVSVIYTTRLACGNWNDVQILAVDQVAPFHASCVSYAAMDTKDFLALVTKDFLEANPMGFPPAPPTPPALKNCTSNWRVVQGSCWQKSMHYEYEPTMDPLPLWQPCHGENCCLKKYTVCVDPCGNRTATPYDSIAPLQSCPITGSYPCTPVCDNDPHG